MRRGSYSAWSVRAEDFPTHASIQEQLAFFVRYAILAPSAHNTQPWRFLVTRNMVRIEEDISRSLPASDATGRERAISVGCALANLLRAAEHFGQSATHIETRRAELRLLVDCVFATWKSTVNVASGNFLQAITSRRSNRAAYDPARAVPPNILQQFRECAVGMDVHLTLIEEQAPIEKVANLTAQATAESMGAPAFRRELSTWVRTNYTKRPDGMPAFGMGIPNLPSLLGPIMVRFPFIAKDEARKRRRQVLTSPLIGVISGPDTQIGWLHAGMLLERIWLHATTAGLQFAAFAAIVEREPRAQELQRLLELPHRPLAMFRTGYGPAALHPSPRRPVSEVLTIDLFPD